MPPPPGVLSLRAKDRPHENREDNKGEKRGRGGNKEEAPARETEGTDSEAHDSKSPTPPETVEPLYQKSVYEILLGGPDR